MVVLWLPFCGGGLVEVLARMAACMIFFFSNGRSLWRNRV